MRNLLFLCLPFLLAACNSPADEKKADTFSGHDTASVEKKWPSGIPKTKIDFKTDVSSYDSIRALQIDTNTLEGKRAEIVRQLILSNPSILPGSDTLLDMNFDGYEDYLVYYTAAAGVGLKNRTEVYLYHKSWKGYANDTLLSSLPNLSFFPEKKMLTSFYIGYNEGSGSQYNWIDNQWKITRHFGVINENGRGRWFISCFEDGDASRRAIMKDFSEFSMVPPPQVLLTKFSRHSSSQQAH